MIEQACIYFQTFSNKDLENLSKLYSDDVTLSDWEPVFYEGKENVLYANKLLFDSVNSIDIIVKRIGNNSNTVFAEIDILINDDTQLFVVDILEFDTNNKIKSIRAYKK